MALSAFDDKSSPPRDKDTAATLGHLSLGMDCSDHGEFAPLSEDGVRGRAQDGDFA
jgi:hypothetical protein